MYIRLLVVIGLLFLGTVGCSSSEMMTSNSVKKEIVIDGNHNDWNGMLKYFESEKVAVGFQNGEENLYFCIVTSDKATIMKIMSMGLTVWFKPGSDEQIIGLQYPKRMDKVAPKSLMGKNRNDKGNTDAEMTISAMMENQGDFALVDEEGEIIYASPIGSNDGFELKVGGINRQFVYEAKVPIGNNNLAQVPINVFPDEKIVVEFETGEIDLDEIKKNAGGQPGMSGGQGAGMQGGGQGMRGQMQGGGQTGVSRMGLEKFNLEIDLKLSK